MEHASHNYTISHNLSYNDIICYNIYPGSKIHTATCKTKKLLI